MIFEILKRYFESNDSKGNVKKLHKSWYFHFAIAIPLLLSTSIALTIYFSSGGLAFCGTSDCFDTALKLFKVPLTTAGVALALGGIAAAVHRSIEASHQIILSEYQYREMVDNNKYTNYFKHKKRFEDYIGSFRGYNNFYAFNKEGLFINIFGNDFFNFSFDGSDYFKNKIALDLYKIKNSECSEYDLIELYRGSFYRIFECMGNTFFMDIFSVENSEIDIVNELSEVDRDAVEYVNEYGEFVIRGFTSMNLRDDILDFFDGITNHLCMSGYDFKRNG